MLEQFSPSTLNISRQDYCDGTKLHGTVPEKDSDVHFQHQMRLSAPELHEKLKVAGANRKQSMLIRNAIQIIIDGNDLYKSGYNQGLKDAIEVIQDCDETYIIVVNSVDMCTYLTACIESLGRSK